VAKDKKKDDELFNCSQEHELNYVAKLYGEKEEVVKKFLKEKCESGEIKNFTHKEVYALIKDGIRD